MLKLKKVAITGDIASGKTTVCHFFEEFGAYVVYTDDIVDELLIPNSIIGKKVIALLGEEILKCGKLDKKKIADEVFNNPSLLYQLEAIIHPEVQHLIEAKYCTVSALNYALFVVEIPLLFEAKMESYYDIIVLVTAQKELSKQRFCKHRNFSLSEFDRRQKRLIPLSKKVKKAQFLIENNGTRDELKEKAKTIFNQLT